MVTYITITKGEGKILLKVPLKRCHYASGFLQSNNSLIWRVSKIYWSSYPNPSYPFFRAWDCRRLVRQSSFLYKYISKTHCVRKEGTFLWAFAGLEY